MGSMLFLSSLVQVPKHVLGSIPYERELRSRVLRAPEVYEA